MNGQAVSDGDAAERSQTVPRDQENVTSQDEPLSAVVKCDSFVCVIEF